MIEDQSVFPILREGVLIKRGSHASINIAKLESSRLGAPYSSCVESESVNTLLSNEMSTLNMTYTTHAEVLEKVLDTQIHKEEN